METVLSGMISNLALPPAPPSKSASTAELPAGHQMESTRGTPTSPNSTSATSPATNSSTPGAIYPAQQQPLMMISPMSGVAQGGGANQQQPPIGHQPHPQQQQRTNRTFFRPPGLGPEGPDGAESFPTNVLVCPHCGFGCSSKFHYNSHMNTHTTHRCPICNYQSRTEGRLRKHIQQSHTHEQRVAAGINISTPPPAMPSGGGGQHNSPRVGDEQPQRVDNANGNGGVGAIIGGGQMPIPTTIAPLLNSMLSDNPSNGLMESTLQSMLNNTNPLAQFSNSTDALLKICTDAISNNGPNEKAYNSPQMGDLGPTALDQLRALAERQAANLLATSTANALGFVGGELDGTIIGGFQENGGGGGDSKKAAGETPRRSGKPKQYKCKQCQHVSRSKKEQWTHARLHIPKQKQLTCELCDFVTEYKHHLEYHYRNHNGQKPFKCNTCAYTCVNKSMLNSHMKSHTPIYQFRCQDCTYQTKYCHSLKMHLKKYAHKRAPGAGGSDSSDSHGEERPENASSSSVGKDESFENGGSTQEGHSGGEMGENGMEIGGMGQSTPGDHHSSSAALLMAQPMVGSTEMAEFASQRFLLQQQLQMEQMNELLRNAVVNCPHCNFSTGNIDEMNRHLLFHLIATQQMSPLSNEQQALASIYQRIAAQLHQELATEGGPMLGQPPADPSSMLIGHIGVPNSANGEMPLDLEKARQMERELAESIRREQGGAHPNGPSTAIAALLEGNRPRECSNNEATPSSSSAEPGPSFGNNQKMEHHFGHHFGGNGTAETEQQQIENEASQNSGKQSASGTCVIKNVVPNIAGALANNFEQQQNGGGPFGLSNHFPNNQGQFVNNLPFYCQQCEIAFKNAVLYQLHCGYHSIESPFKCNRCGHLSGSALEFNLHLYQAKHE